ncbi:hypothetical protein G6F65_019685 [Rhizopus arrhizus]|nr:hypothetical protein G6F65_019685 [Rhizopus arrhizus]
MIEHVMTKERILELYLNVAEWGVGVFGAQAASKHYFNTTAANLGASQAARLAAMLPNPRFYDSRRNSNYLNSRVGVLTRRMQMLSRLRAPFPFHAYRTSLPGPRVLSLLWSGPYGPAGSFHVLRAGGRPGQRGRQVLHDGPALHAGAGHSHPLVRPPAHRAADRRDPGAGGSSAA